MKFTEKYTLDKTVKGEEEKIELIFDNMFVLCEQVDRLINKIEQVRISS